MNNVSSDQSAPARTGLRLLHGVIAFAGIGIGLPLATVGGMSVMGLATDNLWVRLLVPLVVLAVVPLVIADRLLPNDPDKQRRPGLVRDVISGTWAATALIFVAAAGSLTAGPLHAEAERLDADGWSRAAWLGRWMAGPDPASATSADPTTTHDPAVATTSPIEPPTTDKPATADPATTKLADASDPKPSDAAKPTDEKTDVKPADATKPSPTGKQQEYSPAELFAAYAPAVVSIKLEHRGFSAGGTGFFIDAKGTIATNHHVIEDASEVRVKLFDGTEFDRVELLVSDPVVDLALLRIDPSTLPKPPAPTLLGDSETVQVGEPVSVIGNPLGLDHTLTNGIVSARRVYEGERYIQMSAPISPGNSGGPVFDRYGFVIGVSVAGMVGGQNLNLAVPVSQLSAMVADEYPNRRSFGASSW
ncbi:S1C family serine protease [Enhygromyxa salina]|uniref:Putative periplasmic serine endoprotease DegP-like n=1 Tax=Enhygromyxa salina TaxID=215803 RepID=A0A2S9YR12_9BACT|nr:trypsin-like peptidase domain-containing protein [Enhygromyxa salina]PRQ07520.1 putative periplasmic serine endoprotease DegP-like precursor [Enhygromyxa salina]